MTTTQHMTHSLEKNLLQTFRLFLILRFALTGLATLRFAIEDTGGGFPVLSITTLMITGAMLAYLYADVLRRWLGRFYLPMALVVISLHLILEQRLVQLHFAQLNLNMQRDLPPVLESFTLPGIENAAIPLLFTLSVNVFLFVPLVLISWQYTFRHVLAFIAGTTLIDITLMILLSSYMRFDVPIELLGMGVRDTSFLIVGYIVTELMHTQRQQRRDLAENNRQLATYATTREQLFVTQERNRLARELHDTLAHTLSAVTVKLNAVQLLWDSDAPRARQMLHEVIDTMNDGSAETRRALRALRASPLDDLGLVLAVRHLAERAAQRGGFTLDITTPPYNLHLPPETEQAVYRIMQESLMNIVEHANATRVRLSMNHDGQQLCVTIHDDGTGFDADTYTQQNHFGLLGMHERSNMINGNLQITSQQQQGTTVRFNVEIKS